MRIKQFLFGLATLFALGVGRWISTIIFKTRLKPAFTNIINTTSSIPEATKTLIYGRYDMLISIIDIVFYVLFFVTIVYLFIMLFREETEEVIV